MQDLAELSKSTLENKINDSMQNKTLLDEAKLLGENLKRLQWNA